jgi:lipoate-protein ligase A
MIDETVMTEWRVLKLEKRHPFEIAAMEEFLLEKASEDGAPGLLAFHLWNPAFSISKNQSSLDINIKKCRKENVEVVRTMVGGRAVYHDPDHSLSFCAALGLNHFKGKTTAPQIFEFFLQRIIRGLNGIGIQADLYDKNYIRADGKKISGTAMNIDGRGVVIHGSLLYDIPDKNAYVSRMLGLMNLNGHPRGQFHKDIAEMITCVREHNPNISREDVCEKLARGFAGTDTWNYRKLSSEEKARIFQLMNSKYSILEWHEGYQERGLCWRPYGPVPLSETRGENPK